jgi:RNA polymerase sigma-70 factor, ECF subfamily
MLPPTTVASSLPIAALFKAHAPYLWRVLRRMGMGEADADDLCQEAFMVAHRNQASFRGESSERTWLYGICVRLASDHRKKAHVRKEHAVASLPEVTVQAAQHDELESQQARALLDKALAALDEDRRAVFVLYEIEDLSLQEIADCLHIPLQTAYSRLKSGRQQLTNAFQTAFEVAPQATARAMEGS